MTSRVRRSFLSTTERSSYVDQRSDDWPTKEAVDALIRG
jgi:hypothetical protein